MNQKEDLRIIKTHKALCESFSELIEKKRFEEITINELCDHAMIRRATFYKHFGDKYEFFAFFIKQIQESILKQYKEKEHLDAPFLVPQYYRFLFHGAITFLSSHKKMVDNIIQSSAFPTLLDIFSQEIQRDMLLFLMSDNTEKDALPVPALTLSTFLSGGIVQLLRYWLTNSDTVSEEKICSEYEKILSSVLVFQ